MTEAVNVEGDTRVEIGHAERHGVDVAKEWCRHCATVDDFVYPSLSVWVSLIAGKPRRSR